jgi:hypothetical protein
MLIVIIEAAGRKITGLDDFDLALRRFTSGDGDGSPIHRPSAPASR